jgi:ribosomal protein S18 acetylase RimI-like enzyme
MAAERIFLIAPVEALLIAEPTAESRLITDEDVRAAAQVVLDAYPGSPGQVRLLENSVAKIEWLLSGASGEPRRSAWRGIWEGPAMASAILCTSWRGMPYIAELVTVPSAREQGYASSLVREFAEQVRIEGGSHIGLMVAGDNPGMHLFRELGFVEMFTPAGL